MNFPVCLAPMVGLSHVALRLLVRKYTPEGVCTPWPTEMLSSWRLPKEDLATTDETLKADEFPLVPQILGNEEEPIAQSVRKLMDWGAAAIDINMGCPVSKALRHNYGVALMGDAQYAAEVVRVTVKNSRVPVSVKLRAGLQKDEEFLVRFVRGLQDAGCAWITLHPRLGEQKRRGSADWSQIGRVREHDLGLGGAGPELSVQVHGEERRAGVENPGEQPMRADSRPATTMPRSPAGRRCFTISGKAFWAS